MTSQNIEKLLFTGWLGYKLWRGPGLTQQVRDLRRLASALKATLLARTCIDLCLHVRPAWNPNKVKQEILRSVCLTDASGKLKWFASQCFHLKSMPYARDQTFIFVTSLLISFGLKDNEKLKVAQFFLTVSTVPFDFIGCYCPFFLLMFYQLV